MSDREILTEPYRFGYQGQYAEEETETGWNSFDLRMYDARFGRWLSTDFYSQFASPYLGMGNNPVNSIDSDGGYIYILGGNKTLLGSFLNMAYNLGIGKRLIDRYLNDPHRHLYIAFGRIEHATDVYGAAYPDQNIFLDKTSKTFTIQANPRDPVAIDIARTFNGIAIPGMKSNPEFWNSTEHSFMLIDRAKIGNNTFTMLDVIGHEFAHFTGATVNASHTDPSLWGTDTTQDRNNLNLNTLAGQYGQQVLNQMKNGSIYQQQLFIRAGQIVTISLMAQMFRKSMKPLVVPVNGLVKKVIPTIK